MSITREMIERAKQADGAEEPRDLAKENVAELSDDETGGVAGGVDHASGWELPSELTARKKRDIELRERQRQ